MLILSSKDVNYCFVSSENKGSQKAPIPGIAYRGHLFAKLKSYQQNQLDKAIIRCREFLDLEIPVVCLIIKEGNGFSLWYQDSSLKLVKSSSTPRSQSNSQSKQLKGQENPIHSKTKASDNKGSKVNLKTMIPFFSGTKKS